MNKFFSLRKIILHTTIIMIFFSTLNARNVDKFNQGSKISDYFSGIVLLNDNQYDKSYRYFKKLDGLEDTHLNYSLQYLYSLINSEKFYEAFLYSKKLEKNKLDIFESNLIIGIYYLKNDKLDLAAKYFSKMKKKNSNFFLNNFISSSLSNWISFKTMGFNSSKDTLNKLDPKFNNLKKIQNAFLHCYFDRKNTDQVFRKLAQSKETDFSRYNYFYSIYLVNKNRNNLARESISFSLKLYPRNLLLNQLKLDIQTKKTNYSFNCQNEQHVIAELLYITANALSSQSIYITSNFYLNLAKYINKNFNSFDTLLAENLYKIDNYSESKKVYDKISREGSAFFWYSTTQKAKILLMENKTEKALKIMEQAFAKIPNTNIYQKFDYAEFLKNNQQYEKAISFYSEVLKIIDREHKLFAEVKDGRGVAYERLGQWKNAEKDLLSSLESNPKQAYVINYLAYSWIEQGINIDKSLSMLQEANDLKENDPFILDSLGWAFFKLKKYKLSKKYLQQAVELLPADPTVNDHFGDVLWKNGNKIQARYYWNYVLKLEKTEDELKDKIKEKLISGI